MSEKEVTFKGCVVKCIYDSADFKVYALDVDGNAYPDIKKNQYNNSSISGELPKLTTGVEYEITAIETIGKYGVSYKVKNIKRDMPVTEKDTYLFLREILTENQANTLYRNYPDIIDRIKEERLDDIDLDKL